MNKKTSLVPTLSRKEFLQSKHHIQQEPFRTTETNVLAYGAERSRFEKEKLVRLVNLAALVKGKTAENMRQRWKRKVAKLEKTQTRFEKLQLEARQHRLVVEPPRSCRLDAGALIEQIRRQDQRA